MTAAGGLLSHGRWTVAVGPRAAPHGRCLVSAVARPLSHSRCHTTAGVWSLLYGRSRLEGGRQRTTAAANAVDTVWAKTSIVDPKKLCWPVFSFAEKPRRVSLGTKGSEMAAVCASSEATATRTAELAQRWGRQEVAPGRASAADSARRRTSTMGRKKPRWLRADLLLSPGDSDAFKPAAGPRGNKESFGSSSEGGGDGHRPAATGA